jgi:competence transcription factor ComK
MLKFLQNVDNKKNKPINKIEQPRYLDDDQMSFKLAYGSSWEQFYNSSIKFMSFQDDNKTKSTNEQFNTLKIGIGEFDYYDNLSMMLIQGCTDEEKLC